ncbi:hypothetical protein NCC49_003551 [Naganishia albida]|nr:hypothetical protein NCC49_003551 [Naganishia albida]
MSQGNINHSMRVNYSQFGVDEYYRKVGSSYRNPFFPGIRKVIFTLMDKWWTEEKAGRAVTQGEDASPIQPELAILDLAAGSGEATICLQEWHATRTGKLESRPQPQVPAAIAQAVTPSPVNPVSDGQGHLPNPLAALRGSSTLFHGANRPAFVPPSRRQAPAVANASNNVAGSKIDSSIPELRIIATDPFTVSAYETRTSGTCLPLSFEDIVQGKLPGTPKQYDLVICSFALHLVGDHSEMFSLLYELSQRAKWMVVLAPHKKPEIKEGWGWIHWDITAWEDGRSKLYTSSEQAEEEDAEDGSRPSSEIYRNGGLEVVIDRVRCRLYKSGIAEEVDA